MEHLDEERVADRMNSEPAIFKGCSTTELLAIALLATVFWLPTSLLISALFGAITMGLGATGVGVVATVVVSASIFQKIKNGKPDGYYQQRTRIWLSERKLISSRLVLRSGSWYLGRTNCA